MNLVAETSSERLLLDTAIVVRYAREDALSAAIESQYRLSSLSLVPLISIVSVGELYSLAGQWNWGQAKVRKLEGLINDLVIVPLDYSGIVRAYATIDAYCVKNGLPHGENDVWIAATAHVTATRLLTTDRDFDGLDPVFISHDWIDPHTI